MFFRLLPNDYSSPVSCWYPTIKTKYFMVHFLISQWSVPNLKSHDGDKTGELDHFRSLRSGNILVLVASWPGACGCRRVWWRSRRVWGGCWTVRWGRGVGLRHSGGGAVSWGGGTYWVLSLTCGMEGWEALALI